MATAERPPWIVSARASITAMAKRVTRGGVVKHESGLSVRRADLSRARPFRFAWNQRILLGYLNLQVGEEGIGKGNLTAWQAARITRGELDGDLKGTPRRVVFIGDEDAWDHIWVPRLYAAGADLDLCAYIEAGTNGDVLDVRKDADALRDFIQDQDIAFAYFDQLLDNLGSKTDTWKDADVRKALAPLRRVAQATDCAFLCSMHPNKRGGQFRDRISGTPAFNALSRSSLLVAPHPDEEGRVVVVRAKGNYTAEPPAFEFRVEEATVTAGDGGGARTLTTSRIGSIRETGLRRDELLAASTARNRPESDASRAKARLSEMFSNGEVRPAREVIEQMDAEGFKERVTQRARHDLGIKTWKEGFQGAQVWGWKAEPKLKVKRRRGVPKAPPGGNGDDAAANDPTG